MEIGISLSSATSTPGPAAGRHLIARTRDGATTVDLRSVVPADDEVVIAVLTSALHDPAPVDAP